MKSCPVCHARAFDDAEVCYGCMHRYEDAAAYGCAAIGDAARGSGGAALAEGPSSSGEKVAPSQGCAGRHAAVSGGGSGEGSLRAGAGDGRASAQQERLQVGAPEKGGRAVQPTGRSATDAAFDGSGWVVRFELPGYEPGAVRLPSSNIPPRSHAFGEVESSLPRAALEGPARPLPLTISICPAFGEDSRGAGQQAGGSDATAAHRVARGGGRRGART